MSQREYPKGSSSRRVDPSHPPYFTRHGQHTPTRYTVSSPIHSGCKRLRVQTFSVNLQSKNPLSPALCYIIAAVFFFSAEEVTNPRCMYGTQQDLTYIHTYVHTCVVLDCRQYIVISCITVRMAASATVVRLFWGLASVPPPPSQNHPYLPACQCSIDSF